MSGTYYQFVVHDVLEGPSHYYFRITINNFYIPDKKTRKSHIKNNEWYEFSGYIEYWIDDDHMDFLSCLPSYGRTIPIEAVPWLHFDGRPSIIKKSQATIKIQPYEKHPELWNIWFEGIGYAFYFYQTNYYDLWRYRDRSKVYTYYFYKNENKESATYPSGSNISNIQEYVQYRMK